MHREILSFGRHYVFKAGAGKSLHGTAASGKQFGSPAEDDIACMGGIPSAKEYRICGEGGAGMSGMAAVLHTGVGSGGGDEKGNRCRRFVTCKEGKIIETFKGLLAKQAALLYSTKQKGLENQSFYYACINYSILIPSKSISKSSYIPTFTLSEKEYCSNVSCSK